MRKAILIIVDGVGYDTMLSQCGYVESSVEAGIARRWKMQACPRYLHRCMKSCRAR